MWYFSWILGVGLAAAFAILNAMWLEFDADRDASGQGIEDQRPRDNGPLP